MSLGHGATIQQGLVFAYDMANIHKSWKGKPTVNLVGSNADFSNGTTGWSFDAGLDYDVGYYYGKQHVLRVRRPAGTTGYIGPKKFDDIPISPNTQYTCTIRALLPQKLEQSIRYYFRELDAGGTMIDWRHYITLGPTTPVGEWLEYSYTWTSAANANRLDYVSFDWHTTASSIDETVYIENFQLEQSAYATPFTNGTRTNNNSLLDWTGNKTITASSLNYTSNNQFNFTSQSHNIVVDSNSFVIPREKTLSIWIRSNRPLSNADNWEVGFLNQGSVPGSMFGFMYGVGECQDLGFWGYASTYDASIVSTTNKWSSDGNWHNAVLTMDGARVVRCYVDGKQVQFLTHANYTSLVNTLTMPIDTTNYFVINSRGAWNSGMTYVDLPVVHVYSRALSADEVQHNFSALRGRFGI